MRNAADTSHTTPRNPCVDRRAPATSVSVTDLHYEPDTGQRSKACLQVCVAFEESEFDFGLSFPIHGQTGEIEETLDAARKQLACLFEAALNDLRRAPLRLQ